MTKQQIVFLLGILLFLPVPPVSEGQTHRSTGQGARNVPVVGVFDSCDCGTGSGIVTINVNGKMMRFSYYPSTKFQGFGDGRAWSRGAQWRITSYSRETGGERELVISDATFLGLVPSNSAAREASEKVPIGPVKNLGRSKSSKRSSGISQASAAERALANKRWPAFIAAFRAAVTKRDRATLRGMILVPFNAQGKILNSPDEVFKLIDVEKWWSELRKETAPGARFTSSDVPTNWKGAPNPKIEKCARDGIFCFDFGTDGRWRLSAQVENE